MFKLTRPHPILRKLRTRLIPDQIAHAVFPTVEIMRREDVFLEGGFVGV